MSSKPPDDSVPDYVLNNRAQWDAQAGDWVDAGERGWVEDPAWGIWHIPETELHLLPADMSGMRAIELGCGTAYVSRWMNRRGASVVGIDNSEGQLKTARRLAAEHSVDLELLHGNAETVPYPDASFDFAISEYGAAIWADPYRWIPEAWRLLRPGGELVFLGNHPMATVAVDWSQDAPATRTLLNPYFGMHRIDYQEPDGSPGTEFNLPISEWMRLFSEVGFEVISFLELRSKKRDDKQVFFVTADWAYDYPSEQVWKLRKT